VPVTAARKTKSAVLNRQSIEEKALSYLDKFDASAAKLRQILTDFVLRRAKANAIDAKPYLDIVNETLERYRGSGLLDDRRFATTMARSLGERGLSRQAIRAKLLGRGVGVDVIDEVTRELATEGRSEFAAARALVKKRKLGYFRPESERRANQRRDLGILARAGFDFATARAALGVEGRTDDDEF
jgi:regulatory protein